MSRKITWIWIYRHSCSFMAMRVSHFKYILNNINNIVPSVIVSTVIKLISPLRSSAEETWRTVSVHLWPEMPYQAFLTGIKHKVLLNLQGHISRMYFIKVCIIIGTTKDFFYECEDACSAKNISNKAVAEFEKITRLIYSILHFGKTNFTTISIS